MILSFNNLKNFYQFLILCWNRKRVIFKETHLIAIFMLAGCISADLHRESTPLSSFSSIINVERTWKANVGGKEGRFLQPIVVGRSVYATGADGLVTKFDLETGREIWHVDLNTDISAGIGSDGYVSAVGKANGDVIVLSDEGIQLWKSNVNDAILSPPLVGNGLVIVRTVGGKIVALSAKTGQKKWEFQNLPVPMNLYTTQGMIFLGKSVLVGLSRGSIAMINSENGFLSWKSHIAFPHGVIDPERINDVSTPAIIGSIVCASSFQGRIGCYDINSGESLWSKPFSAYSGVALDGNIVIAISDSSILNAYDVLTGDLLWKNEKLKNRNLGIPSIINGMIVVGDFKGFVHFLSVKNGELIARGKIDEDDSAIFAPPIVAEKTLIMQTCSGDLYGFQLH